MAREYEGRLSARVTVRILAERLTNDQLLQLVGNTSYKNHQQYILKELQPVNGLGVDSFRKVHSSKSCKIDEVETGEDLRIGGTDLDIGAWSDQVPLKKLVCTKHNVVSNTFFSYHGDVREAPF